MLLYSGSEKHLNSQTVLDIAGPEGSYHGEESTGCGVYQLSLLGLKFTCWLFKHGKIENLSDSTSFVKWR